MTFNDEDVYKKIFNTHGVTKSLRKKFMFLEFTI